MAGAAALIALPALIPYHGEPLRAFYQDWLALVLGLVAALPLAWPRRGESFTVPWLALGLFGLAVVIALQAALGRVAFVESSAIGVFYVAWAGVMVMAGARLRETFGLERSATAFQLAFAAVGFLLSITAFMLMYRVGLAGFEILGPAGLQGTIGAVGQANYFANIVACGLASVLFLAVRAQIRLSIAALAGAPMVLALAFSTQRSVWLFIAIILGCLAMRRERRACVIAAAAAALFILASTRLFAIPADQTVTVVQRFASSLDVTGDPRVALASYAWQMFVAQPLLGVGWGEFAGHAYQMGAAQLGGIARHSHNLVLQLVAETGIVGAAFVLVPLTLWLCRMCRVLCKTAVANSQICMTWPLAIVGVQLTQAMLELPHWYAYLLGPFALVLGLGAAGGVRVRIGAIGRFAPRTLLAGAIAVAVVTITDYRALERWTAEAFTLQRAGRPLPLDLLARLEKLDSTLFAPEVEAFAAQIPMPGDVERQLALTARVMRVYPLPAIAARHAELLDQTAIRR